MSRVTILLRSGVCALGPAVLVGLALLVVGCGGEATLKLPFTRPKGTRFCVEVSYDVDGLMQATFTDPETGLAFGNVNIDRSDNLSRKSVDDKRVRLEGMAIG